MNCNSNSKLNEGIHPLLVEVGGASSPPTAVETEPAGIQTVNLPPDQKRRWVRLIVCFLLDGLP